VAAAQEWIADRGLTGDPWQRSSATAAAILRHGGTLRAAAAARTGTLTAALVWHERPGRAVVLQIAADDEQSAAEALLAASGGTRDVRLTNIEADDPASLALERLGARLVARQHEMRLRG
jgi:hypothetical protein